MAEKESTTTFTSHFNSDNGSLQKLDVGHQHHLTNFFTWIDYSLFGVMLMLSALIGIYFGFFAKRKQDSTVQYLLGGKKMKFFPIAASLIASHVNGFTMLAVPAEVYGHGSEYTLCVISSFLVSCQYFFTFQSRSLTNISSQIDGNCFDLRLSACVLRLTTDIIIPISRIKIQS